MTLLVVDFPTYRKLLELDQRRMEQEFRIETSPAYVSSTEDLAWRAELRMPGFGETVRDGFLRPASLWMNGLKALLGEQVLDRLVKAGGKRRIQIDPRATMPIVYDRFGRLCT